VNPVSRQLDQELRRIRERVVFMSGSVEAMIEGAVLALIDRNRSRAEMVIDADREVDRLENEIDALCHSVLVRHQPTAVDHRFLMAVMKITNDLERMGDSAKNIARSVLRISPEHPLKPYVDLPRMSELAQAMVSDALDSFVVEDAVAAHLLMIARNLERIADHATNVAESVIYYLEGRDVRHPAAAGN
jgi:phosphate transport system protein